MTTGILRIQAFAARKSAPVEGVRIAITGMALPQCAIPMPRAMPRM